ncbi:hypothetical protein Tco_0968878 [Tanacetum coccineum]
MAGSEDDIPPPPPPPSQTPTQQTPHTVSTIKLPILKKGEYDIWAMKMKYYLAYTDYHIWEVIQRGNGPEAIKSRFGGNDESKKMHKYILKQLFEGFSISNSEGLHKGYDGFQSIVSQLEIHGADVSTKDANQKFLRSLPSAWSQVSLIMRTKPGVDNLSFDDLYNNLRVFESDVKSSIASSSSTQNVTFVLENTSSTNDVSTAYGVSNSSDLEQLDEFDLEEMDLKWQVAMISMRMKKRQVESYNLMPRTGHFARECRSNGNQDSRRRDAWNTRNKYKENGRRSEDEQENYALMACSSSGSDTEREKLGDVSIEIQAYTQALKKVEAQLVAHQQSQLWYEEKIRFMKINLDDKTDVLTYHKKLLAEAEKEKEDQGIRIESDSLPHAHIQALKTYIWHQDSRIMKAQEIVNLDEEEEFTSFHDDAKYKHVGQDTSSQDGKDVKDKQGKDLKISD